MKKEFVSNCCGSSVMIAGGGMTHWNACSKCGEQTIPVAKKEAIVGIREDGQVRAVWCIDTPADEKKIPKVKKEWKALGRTIKRRSQRHAFALGGLQWMEEVVI